MDRPIRLTTIGLCIATLACSTTTAPTPTLFVLPTIPPPEATNAPVHTPTPQLAVSEESGYTLEDIEYYSDLQALISVLLTGSKWREDRISELENNPDAKNDPGWRKLVSIHVAYIHYAYTQLTNIEPSPEFVEIHTAILAATQQCELGVEQNNLWLQNTADASYLTAATTYFESCYEAYHLPDDLLQALITSHGGAPTLPDLEWKTKTYLHERFITLQIAQATKLEFDTTFGQFIEGKTQANNSQWQDTTSNLMYEFASVMAWYTIISTPESLIEAHEKGDSALNHCAIGFSILWDGAVQNNPTLYQSGIPDITQCNTEWVESNSMIYRTISANPEISSLASEFVFPGPSP